MIYAGTDAVDGAFSKAQFFCGTHSLVCDAIGIKTDKQFVATLWDNIKKRGAMDTLISD